MTTYEHALIYAAIGLHVFPIYMESKTPAIKDWPNKGTTDSKQIREWFEFTDKSIGIVTGEVSGINVIDIDAKNGVDGFESLDNEYKGDFQLPTKFLLFETPHDGIHIPVKWTPETDVNSTTKVNGLEGVDIRGNGGFIVAPPSTLIVNDLIKSYRANDFKLLITEPTGWMKALLVQYKNNQSSTSNSNKSSDRKSAFDPTEPMIGVKQGERNNTLLRYASHLLGHGFDKGVVTGFVLQAAKLCTPVFPENEAQQVIDSAFSYKKSQRKSNSQHSRINSLEDTL
jgi:hypothetical protein